MRRQTTEDDSRDSVSMYEDLVSTIPVGVYRFTMKAAGEWQFDFVNSRFCDLTGLNREDVLNNYETAFRIVHPDDFPEFISLVESVEKNPAPFGWKGRIVVNGETRWVSLKSKPTVMDNGDIVWSGYFKDINERKRAENELRQSEARFRSYFELPLIGIAITSVDKHWLEVNSTLCDMLGYSPQELTGMKWTQLTHPDDIDPDLVQFNRMLGGQIDNYSMEKRFIRKDGAIIWTNLSVGCVRKPEDAVEYVVALLQDITGRKKAEEGLKASEERLRLARRATNDVIWDWDVVHDAQSWNASGTTVFGWTDIVERPQNAAWWVDKVHPGDRQRVADGFFSVLENPSSDSWHDEYRFLKADGSYAEVLDRGYVLRDELSKPVRMVGAMLDITERKRTEEALRTSEERYRQLAAVAFEAIIFHEEGVLIDANDQFFQMFGYEPGELVGKQTIEKLLTPESAKTVRAHIDERSTESYVVTGLRKDGSTVPIEVRARMWEIDGKIIRATAIRDISALKDLEYQLFQSQKLESLGTLVGGIAHDFNNMLQIILGYSDILLTDKAKSDPGYEEISTIIETAEGGAELVKKLLAFGQQSPTFPVNLDLNHHISQMTSLISRTLPQVVQVDLDLVDGPTTIQADPNQIDQMLMNLAINAAEAMPDGGRLKISTGTVSFHGEHCRICNGVKRGSYVTLSVMDSGRGMDKGTLSRIFEPFFSTKQRGSVRGTGLGLSVVQGIAQQHGGHIDCESAPGKGTEFRIYFPAIEEPLKEVKSVAPAVQSGGSETILVVEDNIPVAQLEERFLTGAGYNVIVATNGREALDIYRSRKEEISLVVLDLLMPEMSGRDCLMEMVRIDPSVNVLIASGYAPGDELHREIQPFVRGFLQKPFAMTDLLNQARAALSRS